MLAFLRHLEGGSPFVSSKQLAAELEDGELAALRGAGILRAASPLTTVPCDVKGKQCFRNVTREGIGICKDGKRTCADVKVDPADIAQEEISPSDLVRALRVLYAAEPRGLTTPGAFANDRPLSVGWQAGDKPERQVVLATSAQASHLALSHARPMLVLVPTARVLTPALRAQHGPGAFTRVEVLAETLVVRGQKLARQDAGDPPASTRARAPVSSRGAPASPPAAAVKARPKGLPAMVLRIQGAKKWRDVQLYLVDGHTLRVDVAGEARRCTYVDFGLAHAKNRKPLKEWLVLAAVCEGGGSFQWRPFGDHPAVQKVVSRLRARLKAIFGLRETPFAQFSFHHGWRARFRAYPEPPEPKPFVPRKVEK
jgi:hypothetical protein